ncbi:TetR family transcriptional regulator [Microvirga vignae]|uniref:TetR family transcriptional regulator n=1 Tax=Microvirga vignae TaxID=1225564 RepID=A0A0H1R5N9_9HYPH|nr:TetR/AcrR family transcriptional regulator [Microvirga vignae]KLK90458.1 TetR family transcriptional regulator [Microvirga vignae]
MDADAAITSVEPDTRSRIVETAERLFRQIGYQKTTVADIAKALRMSPANVYRFFESKKAINEAVAERLMHEVEGAIEAIACRKAPAADRLRDMIATMHRMTAVLYTDELRMHEMVERALSESWQVVHDHLERKSAIFQRVVEEGIAAGEFTSADPVVASRCVQVALIRFCHPALLVQCAGEPGPSLDQMTEFVLAGLGCHTGSTEGGSCHDDRGQTRD